MTPERIKEILNKGFKISDLNSEDPKYKEFVSRVLRAQEITIKNNLTFAIKLELIVDAGVKFFIQPFGMTADAMSHAHYLASYIYNVVPSDWDKYHDDDLAKLLAQQVADVYKNTISRIRQRKFRKHLQKEDTFQLENLSRKQAHELDINRRFNKAAPPLIIREIPVDGLDFNNLSIEDKQAIKMFEIKQEIAECLNKDLKPLSETVNEVIKSANEMYRKAKFLDAARIWSQAERESSRLHGVKSNIKKYEGRDLVCHPQVAYCLYAASEAYSKAGKVIERENCRARLKEVLKNENCGKEFKGYWEYFKTLSSKQQLKQEDKKTLTTEIETISLSK